MKKVILTIIFSILYSNICFANIKQITVFRQDMIVKVEDDNNQITYMPCSCNTKRTRLGKFTTSNVYDWHILNADENGKRHYTPMAIRFDGDILFHSVLYNEFGNLLSLEASTYNGIANMEQSQGCVRLRIKDLKYIYDNAKNQNIPVIVTDDKCEYDRFLLVCDENFEKIPCEDSWKGYEPTDEKGKLLYLESILNDNTDNNIETKTLLGYVISNGYEYITVNQYEYTKDIKKAGIFKTESQANEYINTDNWKTWNHIFELDGAPTFTQIIPIYKEDI